MSDAKIVITADDSDVRAAMQRMNSVVSESMGQIRGQLAFVGEAFQKLNTVMAGAVAVLAGGKAFKEGVDTVKDMTLEAVQLSKALGITAEEANVLNTALGNVFLDKDTYVDAVSNITKQLNKNSEAFDQLKIKTRDVQGQFLPMQQIIENTVTRLMSFKEGVDRNIMSNQLLGKSWEDVLKLAKLTPKAMADAAQEVDDYQKTLDPDMVQRYREAMENAGDAFEGIKIAIGSSAMPYLSQFGEWISSVGPAAVREFRNVLNQVSIALDAVGESIDRVFSLVASSLPESVRQMGLLGMAAQVVAVIVTEACYFINVAVESIAACLRDVAAILLTIWSAVTATFRVAGELIGGVVDGITVGLTTIGAVAAKVLAGDFTGAANEWDKGLKALEDKVSTRAANIGRLVKESGKEIAETWAYSGMATASKELAEVERQYQESIGKIFAKNPPDGSKNKNPNGLHGGTDPAVVLGGSSNTRVSEWENKLDAQRQAFAKMQDEAGTFYEYSKQKEADYWKAILQRQDLSKEERLSVEKKYYAINRDIRKDAFEAHIAQYKTEIEAANQNMQKKLQIAEKLAADVRQKYGEESKEYQAAQQQIVQIKRQAADQVRQIEGEKAKRSASHAIAEVDAAEAQTQQEVALGRMTQSELITAEMDFERQRYEIRRAAAEEKMALYRDDPVQYQQSITELEAIDQAHRVKSTQLKTRQAQEDLKYWSSLESGMTSMFENGLNRMMNGTLKFRDALKMVWAEMGKLFIQNLIIKPMAEWMAMQVKQLALEGYFAAKKLVIGQTAIAAETGAKTAGVATQTSVTVAGAETEVGAKATSAGAGAASSQAGIPIVGPALAIGAMLAIIATVMALKGKLRSASGGYDIPSGLNPLTQLHQEEMVLPAKYANVIRSMAQGSGQQASGDGASVATHVVNYHDNSGRLTRDQIRQNAKVIADELSRITKRGYSPA